MKLAYKFNYYNKNKELSNLCSLANNLYNQANYTVTSTLEKENKWIRYNELNDIMKMTKNLEGTINYELLKAQTSQQILRKLDKNWISFFRSIKDWKKNPTKYNDKPNPPRYKKKGDKYNLIYTNQNAVIRDNELILSKTLSILLPKTPEDLSKFKQVHIKPKRRHYEIVVVYEKECLNETLDKENYLSGDLGVNNLLACISKNNSFLMSGKTVKAENQYFNKNLSINKSISDKKKGYGLCGRRTYELSFHRDNFINDQFHKDTRFLINYCLRNNIGTIVVGYNEGWKDSISIGSKSNQKFCYIPYHKFLKFLQYKCDMVGIRLIINEESYTSKCDGLALEPVEYHDQYLGKRVKRGLFQSSVGKLINADINGALNTLRKVIGDSSFIREIIDSAVLFNPIKIRPVDFVSGQTLLNSLCGVVKDF